MRCLSFRRTVHVGFGTSIPLMGTHPLSSGGLHASRPASRPAAKIQTKSKISIPLLVVLIFFVSLPHQNSTVMLKETFSKNHNFKAGTVRHGETYGGVVEYAVLLHRLFSLPKFHNYAKIKCKSCSDCKRAQSKSHQYRVQQNLP